MGKKSAPADGVREAPSLMLLALVSQFLAEHGFNSSHRIFDTERRKRPKKEGWAGTLGSDYTANVPKLDAIFKQWEAEHPLEQKSKSDSEASSSDEESTSDSSDAESAESSSDSEASDDESSSESGSDVDMEDVKEEQQAASESSSEEESESESSDSDDEPTTKVQPAAANPLKRKASDSSSESDESSSESGDSSSEDEKAAPLTKKAKLAAPESSSESESESDAESSSSSDSGSDSDSESDSDELTVAANTKLPESDSSEASSSEDSSSDSSSDEDEEEGSRLPTNGVANDARASSDSSGTITGEVKSKAAPETSAPQPEVKKRHMGAHPTRLAQISAAADPDQFISNEYVSYEYADKAYRDLSVTRGKGFTKEKNKKKRGSYRGGPIDTSGGKGIKFAD